MKVFMTGATGYVGRKILCDLLKEGYHIRALIRPGSESKLPSSIEGRIEKVYGDITDLKSLKEKIKGCSAVIHLPGIIREFPKKGLTYELIHYNGAKNVIDIAVKEGTERFILMSALGVKPDGVSNYQISKYKAEEYLKNSGLKYTIFRPSVIFGCEDKSATNFIKVILNLLKLPIVPVIGSGKYQLQPIAIENISQGVVKCLIMNETIGKTYESAGPEKFTYNEIVEMVGKAIGKKKILRIHIPVTLIMLQAKLLQNYSFFPISVSQLKMLLEDNITDNWEEFFNTFKIEPIKFVDGLKNLKKINQND